MSLGTGSLYIELGSPWENGYCESFNGKLRDECLNENWFVNLEHARQKIEEWRQDYNEVRPHSALGYRTPKEFAGEKQTLPGREESSGAPLQTAAPPITGMLYNTPELSSWLVQRREKVRHASIERRASPHCWKRHPSGS